MKMKTVLFISLLCFSTLAVYPQSQTWRTLQSEGEVLERHENALTQVGDKILLIGGRGQKPVNIFDMNSRQWSEGAQPPLEMHHMQAVSLDGLVYVLGGFTGGWPYETPLTHVLVYDVLEDVWAIGPEIPEGRRRGAAGVVVHNNKIYMVNGIINGHTSGWVNWLDEFDPYSGEWKILPNSPVARDHFHAIAINDKLYVAGGRRSGSAEGGFAGTVKPTNVYDFTNQTWKTLPDIPTPRAGSAASVLNGNPVILGGESDRQEAAHNEVEMLNLTSNTWESLPPLKEGRHGTQAILIDGQIVIGAGSGNRGGGPELNSFEIYSAEENFELTADSLTKGKLQPSVQQVVFTEENPTREIAITNNGGNTAIFINYLQTGKPESFEIVSSVQTPFVLAPGAEFTVEVRTKETFSEDGSATLFLKPLGEAAPVEITLKAE